MFLNVEVNERVAVYGYDFPKEKITAVMIDCPY